VAVRIYTDTSVIGGCEDDEFRVPSRRLMGAFGRGDLTLVLSELTLRELEPSPQAVRDALVSWNFRHVVNLPRIHQYHGVNAKLGYPAIEIRSPREVLVDE
jgi:hypothetical protein